MAGRLTGKVALISGGASGIGAAHVRVFAAEGAKVVAGDLQEDKGKAVVEAVNKSGGEAVFVRLDVTKETDWANAVKEAVSRFGKLTTLINNAGIYWPQGVEAETMEGWNKMVAVNQTGVWLGMKTAIPAMRNAGGGAIVNISSLYGLIGSPSSITYHATKGAVRLMTKAAALEQVAFQTLAELGWYAQAETTGESREPIGDNLLDAVHGHYATRDGKFVALNLIGDGAVHRLREATGMPTLAYDAQGHEIHGDHARYLVVGEIKRQIADWIAARSQEEVLKILRGAGLVVEPCRDSVEAEQYTRTLPCFHQVDDPDLGPIWVPGPVIEARDLEPVTLSSAPHPGEHTYEVLGEVLGLSPDVIAALERQGIVAGPPACERRDRSLR